MKFDQKLSIIEPYKYLNLHTTDFSNYVALTGTALIQTGS